MIENEVVHYDRFGNIEAVDGTLKQGAFITKVNAPSERVYNEGEEAQLRHTSVVVKLGKDKRTIKVRSESLEEAQAKYDAILEDFNNKKRRVGGYEVSIIPWSMAGDNSTSSSWSFSEGGEEPEDVEEVELPIGNMPR